MSIPKGNYVCASKPPLETLNTACQLNFEHAHAEEDSINKNKPNVVNTFQWWGGGGCFRTFTVLLNGEAAAHKQSPVYCLATRAIKPIIIFNLKPEHVDSVTLHVCVLECIKM